MLLSVRVLPAPCADVEVRGLDDGSRDVASGTSVRSSSNCHRRHRHNHSCNKKHHPSGCGGGGSREIHDDGSSAQVRGCVVFCWVLLFLSVGDFFNFMSKWI